MRVRGLSVSKNSLVGVAFFVFFAALAFYTAFSPSQDKRVLHIYNWAHYIPASVIEAFEREEGVKVHYDAFSTLEILEAKLLAAHSGYDVVFPPAFPTLKLFAPAGIFAKLDVTKMPNIQHLDPAVVEKLKMADPEGVYAVPYLWGTTGMIYHKERLASLGDDPPYESWALLFSKPWLKKLAPYHVVLLDSPADVFPDVLFYKRKDPFGFHNDVLKEAASYLAEIRPFIYKFDSSQILQDLASERVAVAEIFSSYAHMAIAAWEKQTGHSPYCYVIPQEGALMWIDTMAIPRDSLNKDLAYKFMNFLMRPQVMAEITNQTYTANAVMGTERWVDPYIQKQKTIYLDASVKKRLLLDQIPPRAYERLRLRYWTMIRAGHNL